MPETLGEALDEGWRLTVRCAHYRDGLRSVKPCIGQHELSLHTMIWTHGRRCPIGYLQGRLRCPKCGSTSIMLMWVSPPAPAARRRA
jgi:hypothetical protein